MKREILFRGKKFSGLNEPYSNEWVEGFYYQLGSQNYIRMDIHVWEVDTDSVGQFTGLTDENGVKIFEGDKLRFEDDQESIVKWMQGGLTIEADFVDYDLTTVGWAIDILGSCEVIGNIHDNPELI